MKPATLRQEFYEKGRFSGFPVYDMHGHMGPFYGIHFPFPDADSMVKDMGRAGVKMLVFCHHSALFSPDTGNAANIEAVRKYPDRLRAYCCVNPNYPDIIKRDLATFDMHADVYVGFKMHASYHGHTLTDDAYRPVWEFADERKLLVLMHTAGVSSSLCGPAPVRKIAEKYNNAALLLGHSCHGSWDEAIRLVKDFPNVYLELCALMTEKGVLERMVAAGAVDRMLFGTDYPWFSHNYYIGAVLGADIEDEDRKKIFSSNGQKLLAPYIDKE